MGSPEDGIEKLRTMHTTHPGGTRGTLPFGDHLPADVDHFHLPHELEPTGRRELIRGIAHRRPVGVLLLRGGVRGARGDLGAVVGVGVGECLDRPGPLA